jgi:hypothetical protein
MTPAEYTKLAVFSSGSRWQPEELRFVRAEPSMIEAVFAGVGEKIGRRLIFRGFGGGHPRDAVELYLGFDDFMIIDLKKEDWQREVGRFEVHIFRDDHCFRLSFDSYTLEEEPNQAAQTTPGNSAPLRV